MSHVVIVGAGIAGVSTVLGLRRLGYSGPITLIGDEAGRPYDRPPLSKPSPSDAGPVTVSAPPEIFSVEQQNDADVNYLDGCSVTSLDRAEKLVTTNTGNVLGYDFLVIATGASARPLTLPGSEHAQTLRTHTDSTRILHSFSPGAHIVIIGGGFIGLELAATARLTDCTVTVIEVGERILARGVPPEIATVLANEHHRNGVDIRLNTSVRSITLADGDRFAVHLDETTTIECDAVIAGVGSVPNTAVAESSGLTVRNGIVVDECMRTEDPAVFAIGDCCSFEHPLFDHQAIRLEVWRNAVDQANAVSQTIVGAVTHTGEVGAIDTVPWFWSDQYALGLQITGLPDRATSSVVRQRDDGATIWFGLNAAGQLVGSAAIGTGTTIARDVRLAEKLIAIQANPSAADLQDESVQLKDLLKRFQMSAQQPAPQPASSGATS
jgi:3-phenylpropionate/trans-cinnamate dioxygenase ferredoxin reductase component